MPPIETIARPCRNRISVEIPKEYGSYSFRVLLFPIPDGKPMSDSSRSCGSNRPRSLLDALLACPRLGEGETLDVSRDSSDFGREIDL